MANVAKYQTHIENLLKEYSHYKPSYGDMETELVFDREHNHYMLVNVGWHDDERVSGCVLHLDIKGNKIELVTKGVPKEDIVLAYHAPYMRKHTGFAVG